MRCPACKNDNPSEATQCGCGKTLPRRKAAKRRALAEEIDSPFSGNFTANNWPAIRAYRTAVWGMIPAAGAFLGPLAVLRGMFALRQGKRDPEFTGGSFAWAAIILGLTLSFTNWAGLTLIYLGLR